MDLSKRAAAMYSGMCAGQLSGPKGPVARFRVPIPGRTAGKFAKRPFYQTSHCQYFPEDSLASIDPV